MIIFVKWFFFQNLCACKGTTNFWNTQGFNGKNQIYLSFYRKDLLFSQLCDCTFGGFLIYKGVPTVLQKNDIRKFVCHFFANLSTTTRNKNIFFVFADEQVFTSSMWSTMQELLTASAARVSSLSREWKTIFFIFVRDEIPYFRKQSCWALSRGSTADWVFRGRWKLAYERAIYS